MRRADKIPRQRRLDAWPCAIAESILRAEIELLLQFEEIAVTDLHAASELQL